MSTNVLAAPGVKSSDIAINQEKSTRKEQLTTTIFKDITRDPEFWKQATLS
jgi:hypothetical protein